MNFKAALEALALPDTLLACADGRISPPIFTLDTPAQWYGFPPALIPLWSSGSRPFYIGYWKHWFVDREPCFVKMYVAAGHLTVEIARTPAQLMGVMAMMSIGVEDGVTPELEQFAQAVGLDCVPALEAQSLKTGDDPQGFANIALFSQKTPLESIVDGAAPYTGDFPNPVDSRRTWWETSCSFEILDRPMPMPAHGQLPAWFDPDREKKPLFDDYLSDGRLDYAWLTLNSTGWSITDARQALVALQERADDRGFDAVVAYWLSLANVSAGGY
ncbi:hypothetical protein [Pseudomonas poae]|nr:hypothetical protein [Pseudomonas poae]